MVLSKNVQNNNYSMNPPILSVRNFQLFPIFQNICAPATSINNFKYIREIYKTLGVPLLETIQERFIFRENRDLRDKTYLFIHSLIQNVLLYVRDVRFITLQNFVFNFDDLN